MSWHDKKPLKQRLLDEQTAAASTVQIKTRRSPILGLVLVTSAALLFGVVAACVKAIMLPTLVLQLCRSVIEWALGVAAAFAYFRGQIGKLPEPRLVPEVEVVQHGFDPAVSPLRKQPPPESQGPPSSLTLLLIGPAELRGWLVLRALLYWLFLAGWWFALSSMPIGDATTIVYVGPIFTATFAFLFLGERIDWTFYPIVVLDGAGLLCITQPTFLFGGASGDGGGSSSKYFLGALSAFLSAVVAGLLPVCTRKSKACFWTAVNHCSSALSALVFTPVAIGIWFFLDPDAYGAVAESLHELVPPVVGGGATSFQPMKWVLLVAATVIGFAGLAMQTLGYQLEEAARASVMTVLEIPFAYLLQFAIFDEEMTALGLLGVGLVVSGTMLNLLRRLNLAATENAANE